MDKTTCTDHGIDYDEGVARFMGKADLYEKFLIRFPEDPDFASLDKAMNERNIKAAFEAAHGLKGVSGNLSINGLYHLLIPFVNALRGEGDLALADSLYPDVRNEYMKAVEFIRTQAR